MPRVSVMIVSLFCLALTSMAVPAVSATPNGIAKAFKGWMKDYAVRKGAIVVFNDGTAVAEMGVGTDLSAPVSWLRCPRRSSGLASQVGSGPVGAKSYQ